MVQGGCFEWQGEGDTEHTDILKHLNEWQGEGDTHHTDILKHLDDGRVHEVVARAVAEERLDHRLKQEVPHDVAVVELVLQADDPTHEPQGALEAKRGGRETFHC